MPLPPISRARPFAVLVLFALLGGCRAMETHDIDGSAYEGDEREFYTAGKRASIDRRGYAYPWRSGDLVGRCTTGPDRLIDDEVRLEAVTLFDTDSARLRPEGERTLEQLVRRVELYEDVREVRLRGHTDHRASLAYNDALSARRNASVRRYLETRLDPAVTIGEEPRGEREPLRHDLGPDALQANRRVVVRVLAAGVRPGRGSIALCAGASDGTPGNALRSTRFIEPGAGGLSRFGGAMPLSPGDRVRISVLGDDAFDGLYEIDADGTLKLPFVEATMARGLRAAELEERLGQRLVEAGIVREPFSKVNVNVVQLALADVYVSGAVFAPGRKTVNTLKTDARAFKQTQIGGDGARERLLSTALAAAGGIRPDADLTAIRVRRDGEILDVDLEGIMTGRHAEDFPLVAGDEIEVPSLGVFLEALVRPSQITPPGVRIFISNLSIPSPSNSLSAIGKDATSMPYGTRFLHALISGNCVGGTQFTNASRRAVLVSTDPASGRTEVIERSIPQLVSDPDRDDINPLLMPNDGVACYDSEVTNLRDVARSVTEVLTPLTLIKTLFFD